MLYLGNTLHRDQLPGYTFVQTDACTFRFGVQMMKLESERIERVVTNTTTIHSIAVCEECRAKDSSSGMAHEAKKRWCLPCGEKRTDAVNLKATMCEDCGAKQASGNHHKRRAISFGA